MGASRTWTILEVLEWASGDFAARGVESPRLDAELLVAHALGIDRIGLYLDLNRPLSESERGAIRPLVARRRDREPVAYILGHRDFYGRRFQVSPDVLIPRPDTETLVEHALEQIPDDEPCSVLDVGTGSGAIAVTIAAERPLASVTGTDVSEAALKVAAVNAEAHGVSERVQWQKANLVDGSKIYRVVVSNPPYVPQPDIAGLAPEVRSYEPSGALDGGQDGLDVIRALLPAVAGATREGAQLLFEIGIGQADLVAEMLESDSDWEALAVHPDINRIARVVHLRRI